MNTSQNTAVTKRVAPTKSARQPRKSRRMAREGAGEADARLANPTPPAAPPPNLPEITQATGTKSAAVIAMLGRPEGATLDEMITATGWLPHTIRAALTGFKKKGHVIVRDKRGEVTCYRIAAA